MFLKIGDTYINPAHIVSVDWTDHVETNDSCIREDIKRFLVVSLAARRIYVAGKSADALADWLTAHADLRLDDDPSVYDRDYLAAKARLADLFDSPH